MFFTFWTPPGALRGPNPFSRDPPGASQSPLWSSGGRPKSSQERPGASKGHIKFTKSACSNPRKYVYLASRDLKKTLSDHFSMLRVPPRDPPVWRPYSSRSPPAPQKGPRELPGTPPGAPQGPPGTPWSTLENPPTKSSVSDPSGGEGLPSPYPLPLDTDSSNRPFCP